MTGADKFIHGDASLWFQWLTRTKDTVQRLRARASPVKKTDEPYLVVAVLGQSNAHGAGVGLDSAGLDAPDPRVHQWPACGRSRGSIALAVEPLLHDVPGKGVGFATTFGRELADHSGQPVLLVPYARGDTSFHPKNGYSWDPSDTTVRVNLYRKAVQQIDSALAAAPGSRLAAILWHQGESDVPHLDPATYTKKLDSLFALLRVRYGHVPLIVGQMVPEEIETGDPNYAALDAVHAGVPKRHVNAAYVPGPRESFNEGEQIHYNAAGQRELGRRMFWALRALD